MELEDKIFYDIRRGRLYGGMQGLVRMDRALLYIRQQLEKIVREIEIRKTKGLGDSIYSLKGFAREVAQLSSLSGDSYLAEQIYGTIRQLSFRTPRKEALGVLRDLSKKLEQYKPTPDADDVDTLKEKISVLEEQLSEPSTEGASADTSESSSVFIIMPFRPEFNDVWKGGIQKAAQSEGFKPIRVDMINRSTNITDDIVDSIEKCHLAIVDVTDNNPNVMFELGYALARKKPNIVISQSADYLPFDIRNIRTIVYSNTWSGIEELRIKIQDFLREFAPKKPPKLQQRRSRLRNRPNQRTKLDPHGAALMIPINYGMIGLDSISRCQRQTGDLRQLIAETIHFLQPGNNPVPSRNALGRQSYLFPFHFSLSVMRLSVMRNTS